MPLASRKNKQLDGREIMALWVEMGSLARVWRYYNTKGLVNDYTGRSFTQGALWRSASTFMIEHPEEAREYYTKAGSVFTDEEWELWVLRRALQIYLNCRSTFLRWVVQKGWPRKYEYLYDKEYGGITEEDYNFFGNTQRRMPSKAGRKSVHSEPV